MTRQTSIAQPPSSFSLIEAYAGHPSPLRRAVTAACRIAEPEAVAALLPQARLPGASAAAAVTLARQLALRLRARGHAEGRAGLVQGLLQQYALSSQEGVALMCLAEALLRIPDAATRDALIRDKIAHGQWQSHLGRSPSAFVNAATWGLLLTGRLVATHSEAGLSSALARLIGRGGEPLIRKGVDMAMRLMGEQFVAGETIAQALRHAHEREAQGFRHSYDMLGEAALTAGDAQRYRAAYEAAIHAIGQAAAGRGVHDGPGISIKLSALHPRYLRAQRARVLAELYPVLRDLTLLARRYDIGLNIDAEEADRLELSLDLLERLCAEPALAGWNGIGFVIQAYQKRAPAVIDVVVDLARRSGHRLMVRLVKGAYWDSEIKRAQVDGLDDYPVFTRKAHTDVSYLACARRLLAAPDAVYPQFATHNAHTVAAVYQLADPARWTPGQYEFQCLHGMGEPLHEQVVGAATAGGLGRPCRIYAPVGTHETLLAYLVRRLLENGANTSFVNRIGDANVPVDALVEDPVDAVERVAHAQGALGGEGAGVIGLPHPAIALPRDLLGPGRVNSRGLDLASDDVLRELQRTLDAQAGRHWRAEPMLGTDDARQVGASEPADPSQAGGVPLLNPADADDRVGEVREATDAEVRRALDCAAAAAAAWAATEPAARAACLARAADRLEADMPELLGLLAREAGKTLANGVAEVREAVDFLRYYAAQVHGSFDNARHRPLGPVVCISPWNFPLAIFTGQVAAALAAGNTVLAKPAEQTPLVAAHAVRRLWDAGVPRGALQLLPGAGETVGAALVADARVQGVLFTGSTEVARLLQRALAGRLSRHGQPVPLVAETGGQNAMIVDSSALAEQVVADVMASAFDSAGQRCSALRVLCVQDDVADRLIEMLEGAMAQARVGDPARLATDVGPVIDAPAREAIERHVEAMRRRGRRVHRAGPPAPDAARGSFVAPTLIEIERLDELEREVFGPVLHVLRWARRDLDALIDAVNRTGYGLTCGVQTRIDETVERVAGRVRAGNLYVNRNIVGAVVGVQPFGGEGLSGTGPKAGGPLYLMRLLAERPDDVLARALGGAQPTAHPGREAPTAGPAAFAALRDWAQRTGHTRLARACAQFARQCEPLWGQGAGVVLPGPTGERNLYTLHPREAVLCLARADDDRLVQLAAVLAVGGTAVWPTAASALAGAGLGEGFETGAAALHAALPDAVRAAIERLDAADDGAGRPWGAVLHHGDGASLLGVQAGIARRTEARAQPIVPVRGCAPGADTVPLEALVVERVLTVNTAAAGGNASLMTLA